MPGNRPNLSATCVSITTTKQAAPNICKSRQTFTLTRPSFCTAHAYLASARWPRGLRYSVSAFAMRVSLLSIDVTWSCRTFIWSPETRSKRLTGVPQVEHWRIVTLWLSPIGAKDESSKLCPLHLMHVVIAILVFLLLGTVCLRTPNMPDHRLFDHARKFQTEALPSGGGSVLIPRHLS